MPPAVKPYLPDRFPSGRQPMLVNDEDCMRRQRKLALLLGLRAHPPGMREVASGMALRCGAPLASARACTPGARIRAPQSLRACLRGGTCARKQLGSASIAVSRARPQPTRDRTQQRLAPKTRPFHLRGGCDRTFFRVFCKRALVMSRGLCHPLQQGQCSTESLAASEPRSSESFGGRATVR